MKTLAPTSKFFVFEAAYEGKKLTSSTHREDQTTHFVDTYGFAVHLNHIHDLDRIIGIIFSHELYKPIALVLLSDTITWHVNIDCIGREPISNA